MKVPILEAPRVAPRGGPLPYSSADTRVQALNLRPLGDALSDAADLASKAYEDASFKSDAIAANEMVAKYQNEDTAALYGSARKREADALYGDLVDKDYEKQLFGDEPSAEGFLNSRGRVAAETSGPTMDYLEKRRKEMRESLTTDRQRAIFDAQTARMAEETSRRIENHTGKQVRVAAVNSIKARQKTELTAIAEEYGNDEFAKERSAQVEEAISALYSDEAPEVAAAAIGEWRQKVARTRLDIHIANGNWQGAEKLFEAQKGVLGQRTDEYAQKIGRARRDGVATGLAKEALDGATNDDGQVDAEAAMFYAEGKEKDPALLEETRKRIEHGAVERNKSWRAETAAITRDARTKFNEGGWAALDAETKEQLNKRNPAAYAALKAKTESAARRAKGGTGEARERREQAERDRIAKKEFQLFSPEERVERLDEFIAARNLSRGAELDLQIASKKTGESIQKGTAQAEKKFVDEVRRDAKTMFKKDVERVNDAASEAVAAFNKHLEEHDGKAPDAEELLRIKAGLLKFDNTKPRILDSVIGKGRETGFEKAKRERQEGAKAAPPPSPAKSKLPPGRYKDKQGKFFVVDANGNKKAE